LATKKKPKTKRQHRKDLQNNDKNKWLIQHPKIQSMSKREQVYVRDAGLNETKAQKKQTPIDPKLDLMSPEVKFGRILAGTDQRKRHAAVKKLRAYLKARCDISEVADGDSIDSIQGGISELDLLKLWKALWYTLYMADKKPVQDELSKQIVQLLWCVIGTEEEDEYAARAYLEMTHAEEQEMLEGDGDDDDEYDVTLEEIENTMKSEMGSDDDNDDDDDDEDEDDQEENDEDEAGMEEDQDESVEMELNDEEIPHCRGAHLVSILVRTFFRTIRRDWGTMDKYRIDKFYTCTRLMMHEIYKYMSVRSWTYGIVLMLNDALFQEILEHPPNGLRYHLIDVCLEELAKVNAKARVPLTEATFLDVLEPFFGLCQTGKNDDTVHERIMEKLIDNFLENYSVVSDKALQEDDDADGNNSTSLIFRNVHVKSIGDFLFTLGSDPLTKDNYRKALYDMHKKYMRRLKKIGKDVDISEQDGSESSGDGEEEDVDDVTLDNIDDSIRFLSSETRAEMRDESEDDDLIDGDEAEEQAEKVKAETEKKESKKKKKKKRKSLESEPEAENNNKVTTDDSGDGKKKKKKKRKSDPEETAPEEEIVITLTEQQDAKKKERNTKKKRKEREEEEREKKEDKSASKGSKRVSFGKKNRAKSHKASMKALRTSEPPNTKQTNPEKGILRKEPKHKSKLKGGTASRKGRQKASNYF